MDDSRENHDVTRDQKYLYYTSNERGTKKRIPKKQAALLADNASE